MGQILLVSYPGDEDVHQLRIIVAGLAQPVVRATCSKCLAASEAVILPALIFSMVRRVSTAKAPKRRVARIRLVFAARIAICRSDIQGPLNDLPINQRT